MLALTSANYPNDAEDPKGTCVILAALSTDETGDFALLEAARLAAESAGSELHVVHVVVEDDSTDGSDGLLALDQRLTRAPKAVEQQSNACTPSFHPG